MNFGEFISQVHESLKEKKFCHLNGNDKYRCLDNIQISMSNKEENSKTTESRITEEQIMIDYYDLYPKEVCEFELSKSDKLSLHSCSFYFNDILIIELPIFIINSGSNSRAVAVPTAECLYPFSFYNDEDITNMTFELCKFFSSNDNLYNKLISVRTTTKQ